MIRLITIKLADQSECKVCCYDSGKMFTSRSYRISLIKMHVFC